MNPELLSQLARERLRDLDRARAHVVPINADIHKARASHTPLRPVGVMFLRVGLWMVAADRVGRAPISMTSAR